MKNVVKIFGIPMSSLGGVHLISGIAQCILASSNLFHFVLFGTTNYFEFPQAQFKKNIMMLSLQRNTVFV